MKNTNSFIYSCIYIYIRLFIPMEKNTTTVKKYLLCTRIRDYVQQNRKTFTASCMNNDISKNNELI